MLATVPGIAHGRGMLLGTLAAGFALWASVSEARSTRYESARDLTLLCLAAGVGAASFAILAKWLGSGWVELTLASGSFCVGYLKRFGVLGGGIGSQLFIGQLLAYGATVVIADLGTVALAVGLAILASVQQVHSPRGARQQDCENGLGHHGRNERYKEPKLLLAA